MPSDRVFCLIVLLPWLLSAFVWIHLLQSSCSLLFQNLELLCLFLVLTALHTRNIFCLFFSRKWHCSSSLWFLPCPKTLTSSLNMFFIYQSSLVNTHGSMYKDPTWVHSFIPFAFVILLLYILYQQNFRNTIYHCNYYFI